MSSTVMDTCPRLDPPSVADEKSMGLAFLDFQRETFICKASGLTADEGWRVLSPTNMSLLGIMKHMTNVEWSWFRTRFAGTPGTTPPPIYDWDACWTPEPGDTPAGILARYQEEVANSRAVAAAHSFDDLGTNPPPRWTEPLSLRWVVLHMIEEVARHNGHADLLREAIDGQVGE